jgi:transketolase
MAQTLDMQQAQRAIDTIRLLSADMVEQAQSGHPGTPMEAAPIAQKVPALQSQKPGLGRA